MNKVTYTDRVTVIPASNLNEIQDAVNSLETTASDIQTQIDNKQGTMTTLTEEEIRSLWA